MQWLAVRVMIAPCMKLSQRLAVVEAEFFIGTCYFHAIIYLSTSHSQKRAGRVRKDKCSKVEQIPTPQVQELSDESISDDESAIILTNLHSGQTLEEVVTGEHPKPLVEVKPPALTQPEYAIPDNSYQGETSGDHTVLEGTKIARSENGDD